MVLGKRRTIEENVSEVVETEGKGEKESVYNVRKKRIRNRNEERQNNYLLNLLSKCITKKYILKKKKQMWP